MRAERAGGPTRVLVSACLLGEPVRYDGGAAPRTDPRLAHWAAAGRLVAFCPEVAAGLSVPRAPAEIAGATGAAVLDGEGRVVDACGCDLTPLFLHGAHLTLQTARAQDCRMAILKDGSPSCGVHRIYDGRFAGRLRPGQGVSAALLDRAGLALFSEGEIDRAAALLEGSRQSGGSSP